VSARGRSGREPGARGTGIYFPAVDRDAEELGSPARTPPRMRSRPSRLLPRAAALLVRGLAALALAACSDSDAGRLERPSIVLITIDTLRADHLGCYGYFRDTTPNIDAFSRDAVVFDQAYAAMATTLPSHASMLTGLNPLEHGILANIQHGGKAFGWKDGMVSIAQVAKDAGYATGGFVSAAPLKKQSGISVGFDTWSEPLESESERRAGETLADALPWLDARKPGEPFFLWVHFYDPHWKHRAPPPYDTMFHSDAADPKLEQWIADRGIGSDAVRVNAKKSTETRKALNDYCGEIRYTDEQVGVLLAKLREIGAFDKSIVVVTSDHGEGLNQHDWASHGLVWDEQLRVPLLMRFPAEAGVPPQRVERLVSLVDLFPTVLARVRPFETDSWPRYFRHATGVDALAADFKERPLFGQRVGRDLPNDPGEMYAVTTAEWKYIHEPEVGDKLFERKSDPHELVDVSERRADVAKRIHDLTMLLRTDQEQRGSRLGTAREGEVDPKLAAQLGELGYGGGDDGRSRFQETPREDAPKPESKNDGGEPQRDAKEP
jgi:arylsulfatase A-like enzyme